MSNMKNDNRIKNVLHFLFIIDHKLISCDLVSGYSTQLMGPVVQFIATNKSAPLFLQHFLSLAISLFSMFSGALFWYVFM